MTIFLLLFALNVQPAFSAVLVDEGTESNSNSTESRERIFKSFENVVVTSIDDLHHQKRAAAGVEFYGKTGLLGITGDFAFLPYDHAVMGFGGGPGFVGMNLGYKHFFSDMKLSPYASGNLSRWMGTTNSPLESTNPGFLAQKFLTEGEKQSGQFAHHFFIPAVGMQWTELPQNAAFFGEVLAFVDLDGFKNIYSGSLGMLYYF